MFPLVPSKRRGGGVLAPTLTLPPPSLLYLPPPTPDNFPQMAHQKRFIERKYRQELKEMRREREQQERDSDEDEDAARK